MPLDRLMGYLGYIPHRVLHLGAVTTEALGGDGDNLAHQRRNDQKRQAQLPVLEHQEAQQAHHHKAFSDCHRRRITCCPGDLIHIVGKL